MFKGLLSARARWHDCLSFLRVSTAREIAIPEWVLTGYIVIKLASCLVRTGSLCTMTRSIPEPSLAAHDIGVTIQSIMGWVLVGERESGRGVCRRGCVGRGRGSSPVSCSRYHFFVRSVVCAFLCPPSHRGMRSGAWPFCVV